ncbi:MAG: methyl-accepting chemotaxis protein [Deferribacteres bacterium]|jgi:methyl-accepting chemotaxis protein|nr:methyl-accepting chemotaxis protein [Deferribacteres bacterium]
MGIKLKMLVSYLLISLIIVIFGIITIGFFSKIKSYINKDVTFNNNLLSKMSDFDIDFLKSTNMVSRILAEDNIEKLNQELESVSANTDKLTNTTKDIKMLNPKIASNLQNELNELDKIIKQMGENKTNYLTLKEDVAKISVKIDDLYRRIKGYIEISLKTIPESNISTLTLFNKMMESNLQFKVYANYMLSQTDEYEIEDSQMSMQSYLKVMSVVAQSILEHKKIQDILPDPVNDPKTRERLQNIIETCNELTPLVDNIYNEYLKAVKLGNNLSSMTVNLEKNITRLDSYIDEQMAMASKNVKNSLDTINSISNSSRVISIIAIIIALAVSSVIGVVSASKVSAPIIKITNVARNIIDGRLDIEDIEIKGSKKDEIAILTKAVNDMKNSLKTLIGKISEFSNMLLNVSQQSLSSMEEMKTSTININEEINQTATAAEEMSSTSQEIETNIHEGVSNINIAKGEIINGNKGLQEAIDNINKIVSEFVEASGSLDELKKSSVEINEIIKLIIDIADQTNLLALNAAIEAARAGEAGRGFAVVADEVRKLAEKSTLSTKNISDKVNIIQKSVDEVVTIVDSGIKNIEEGSREITSVGESFNQATTDLESAVNSISPIQKMAEELNIAISMVASSITNISKSAEENGFIINNIVSLSGEIEKVSEELNDIIKKYKI